MKKIKVFLASSINDLYAERQEISNFICRTLKKAFGNSAEFELEMCEDDMGMVSKTRKQDLYNQYIRESDYLYILFWHDAGEFTVEEFHAAYEHFEKTDKPHIIPFVKILSEGDKGTEALETFIRYMREELQHYYVEFRHVDTVKLRILLALAQDPELHMTVELKDAQVLVNNQELTDEQDRAAISVENIPFYRNHEGINRLRAEIAELEEQKAAARLAVMQTPDDQGAWDKVYAISARWNKLQEELHQYEMQLLETSMRLTKLTADGTYVTPRTKQAIELFEVGKLKEALAVLDMDAFEADLRRAEETAAQSRKRMEALVKELTTRIDILKSQGITKDTAAEIKELYEKARTITLAHRLGLDCVYNYMSFLYRQNDHTRALQVGDQLYHEYKSRENVEKKEWVFFCSGLSLVYSANKRFAEAEKIDTEIVDYFKSIVDVDPTILNKKNMIQSLINLASSYVNGGSYDQAEDVSKEVLWQIDMWSDKNPTVFDYCRAQAYILLAKVYQSAYFDVKHINEIENLYREAVKILRHLTNDNPDDYELLMVKACCDLANFLIDVDRFVDEAESLLKEVLIIYRRMSDDNPIAFEPRLADAYSSIASVYIETGRISEGKYWLTNAVEIYRRLARFHPDVYEIDLANVYSQMAELYAANKYLNEAITLYQESQEIYRRLMLVDPRAFGESFVFSCMSLGNCYDDYGKINEAVKCYEEAEDICRQLTMLSPNNSKYELLTALSCYYLSMQYLEQASMYAKGIELMREFFPIIEKNKNAFAEICGIEDMDEVCEQLKVFLE